MWGLARRFHSFHFETTGFVLWTSAAQAAISSQTRQDRISTPLKTTSGHSSLQTTPNTFLLLLYSSQEPVEQYHHITEPKTHSEKNTSLIEIALSTIFQTIERETACGERRIIHEKERAVRNPRKVACPPAEQPPTHPKERRQWQVTTRNLSELVPLSLHLVRTQLCSHKPFQSTEDDPAVETKMECI